MLKSQHLTAKQIADDIRLRNWTEGEAPPKYRKGVEAFSKLIDKEKQNTETKDTK